MNITQCTSRKDPLLDGWRTTTLGQVTQNYDGRRRPVKADDRAKAPGEYPYYGASGVIDSVDRYIFDGTYLLVAEDGANLLSRSTPIAFTATGRFWVNNHAHILQPKSGCDHAFLEHYLNGLDVSPYVTGSAQPKLTQKALNKIPVPLPPLDEQRRIVAKVDSILEGSNAARENLSRIPGLVERYKRAVLASAFQGVLTNDNPHNWSLVTLGEVLERIDAGKNIRCEERVPLSSERGIVKISSVTWGEFDPNASKTPSSNAILDRKTLIQSGDFLISRANTLELVGACVIVGVLDRRNLYLSDKVLRLRFKQSLERWVMHFLRSADGRRQIQELATGNQLSMRNISQSTLRSIQFPLPPEDVRDRILVSIDKALTAITVTLANAKRAAELLDRLDKATLAKAFRGELLEEQQRTTAKVAVTQ